MTRRRVFVVTRSASFSEGVGGLERAVSDHVEQLTDRGWHVILVSPMRFTHGVPPVEHVDVPWPTPSPSPGGPGFGFAYLIWVRRVRRALRRVASGDAIYVHGAASGALRRLNRPAGVRVVANPHGMEEFAKGGVLRWTNRVFTRHLARGARHSDFVLATDRSLVDAVGTNIGVAPDKVCLLPNGVDLERLDALASKVGVPRPADVISIGRLVTNKGYDLLLDALELRASEHEPVLWRHFGSGGMHDQLVERARGVAGLTLDIVRDAPDARVQSELDHAGIFVQPSRYEGSSLTTLEAMARARKCVGTPVGGIPEKIEDGVTGFLASGVDAHSISEALLRATAAPEGVGRAARALVERQYDIRVLGQRLSDVLEPAPRAPRVIQVARHIGPGTGVAQVAHSLDRAFTEKGFVSKRITLKDAGISFQTPISRNPLMKARLLFEVVWFSIAGTVLAKRARRADPDALLIVHGDPIGGDIYVNHGLMKEVVARRRGPRRFYIPLNPMHWMTLARDEIRYGTRAQSAIVCLNDEDTRTIRQLYPRLKTPLHVIPNGVDMARFHPDQQRRETAREELSLDGEDFVLLFVGNEFERKGLGIILESLPALPSRVKLLVVGGTQEIRAAADTVAFKLGIAERVQFLGPRANTEYFYNAADAFVLPSAYEAAQLVLLEALASGLTCVVTPVGYAPHLIRAGVNGELVDRDVQSVAAGILRVSRLPEATRDRRVEACVSSVAHLSWDAIADMYLRLARNVKN